MCYWTLLCVLKWHSHCTTLYANGPAITMAAGANSRYGPRLPMYLGYYLGLVRTDMECLTGHGGRMRGRELGGRKTSPLHNYIH